MPDDRRNLLSKSLRKNLLAGSLGILLLFGGVGGWAATTELSSAVIAHGVLVVEGNAKQVQHPEGGVVRDLLVREGQSVQAGDVLVRIDDTAARAKLASVEKNITQLLAREARLLAERDASENVATPQELKGRLESSDIAAAMASERQLFADRRASREGQKARLQEQIHQLHEQIAGLELQQQAKVLEIELIAKEREGQYRLFEQGLTSMNRVNNLDRSTARLQGESGQIVASIASARSRIAELQLQRLQVDREFRTEVATELRDVANQLAILAEDEVTARDRLRHTDIKAPISGLVHLLSVHTVGGVVTAAEKLMEIVPNSGVLTVEARVAPQDVDQLALGQTTTLRLTAFNRNTTPELTGSVMRVSADLEMDQTTGASFYRVAITIPSDELQRLPPGLSLLPGMPAEVFVQTGDRTVASYFLKPIRDHANRAFKGE